MTASVPTAPRTQWTSRPAVVTDEAAVAAIDPALYRGLDHLPGVFKHYLADPNRRAQVWLCDGKVIGFQMALVVDEGHTVVHQSFRLDPNFRSKGWWPIMRSQFPLMLRDFPRLQRVALTSAEKSVHLSRIKAGKVTYNYVMERPVTQVRLQSDERSVICSDEFSHRIRGDRKGGVLECVVRLSPADTLKVLECKDNQWKLFPHGRLIVSWEPYRLTTTNLQRLVKTCIDVTFVSRDHGSSEEGSQVAAASFGRAFQVQNGLRYDVEFYGRRVDEAAAHVYHQLKTCWDYYTYGTICLELFTPLTLDTQKLRHILETDFGLNVRKPSLVCHLFEGPYDSPNSKV